MGDSLTSAPAPGNASKPTQKLSVTLGEALILGRKTVLLIFTLANVYILCSLDPGALIGLGLLSKGAAPGSCGLMHDRQESRVLVTVVGRRGKVVFRCGPLW